MLLRRACSPDNLRRLVRARRRGAVRGERSFSYLAFFRAVSAGGCRGGCDCGEGVLAGATGAAARELVWSWGEELLLLAGGAAWWLGGSLSRLGGALRGQVLEEGGVERGGVGLWGGEAGAVLADPAWSRAFEGGGEGEALDESVPTLGDELLGLRALQLAGDPLHRAELGE